MNLRKWMRAVPVIVGILLLLLGLLAMLLPATVVKVLPLLVGIVVLSLGIYGVCTGFDRDAGFNSLGMPRFLQGLINLAVGLVLVFNRSVSVAFFGIVLGLWGIIGGAISLRAAVVRRRQGVPVSLVDGIVKIGIGLIMMLFPFGGMAAWTAVIGWFALFSGVSVLISAYVLHKYM